MFFENIKEAIISILSNKMRSLLTMLGIIIGISSVIIITTIGGSIQSTLTATMNSLGGNTVSGYVEARYPEDDADWDTWIYPDMTQSDYVSQEMIDELVEKYPVLIEMVDEPGKIDKFAKTIEPVLNSQPKGCLMLVQDIEVLFKKHGTKAQ